MKLKNQKKTTLLNNVQLFLYDFLLICHLYYNIQEKNVLLHQ